MDITQETACSIGIAAATHTVAKNNSMVQMLIHMQTNNSLVCLRVCDMFVDARKLQGSTATVISSLRVRTRCAEALLVVVSDCKWSRNLA